MNKSSINNLLTNEDKNKLIVKASSLMGDISKNMNESLAGNFLNSTINNSYVNYNKEKKN